MIDANHRGTETMASTNKVTVHSYRFFDGASDTNDIRPAKATAEAIKRFNGTIEAGTAEVIDATLLDGQGIYRPDWTRDELGFLERLTKGHWISAGLFDHRQFSRLVNAKLITATVVNISDVLYEIANEGRAVIAKKAA